MSEYPRSSSGVSMNLLVKRLAEHGLAIVPIEPTIEMCDAATRSTSAFMALEQRDVDLRRLKHGIRYRAMLAARPEADSAIAQQYEDAGEDPF